MIDEFNAKTLVNTVCSVEVKRADGKYYGGHGCLILPDVLVTSWHVIQGATEIVVVNNEGKAATILKGSALNKRDTVLDIATMELTGSLTRMPAFYGDTDKYMQSLNGFLITRFTGSPSIHKTGMDITRIVEDSQDIRGGKRNYVSMQKVEKGYSGSPVFDSRGRLCSVLSGVIAEKPGDILPEKSHNFFGPAPHRLAAFLKQSLDI